MDYKPGTLTAIARDENGKEIVRQRKEHVKMLDDDLPEIALNYKKYLDGKL